MANCGGVITDVQVHFCELDTKIHYLIVDEAPAHLIINVPKIWVLSADIDVNVSYVDFAVDKKSLRNFLERDCSLSKLSGDESEVNHFTMNSRGASLEINVDSDSEKIMVHNRTTANEFIEPLHTLA